MVRDSDAVLVCRLLRGKVTFVHRRLWPALVRAADRFPATPLARFRGIHTSAGRHRIDTVPFPEWVPPAVRAAAQRVSRHVAVARLTRWVERR
jgi:hypothetical protein